LSIPFHKKRKISGSLPRPIGYFTDIKKEHWFVAGGMRKGVIVLSALEISCGIENKDDIYIDIDGAGVTVTS
jgi:hypothetical protein